MSLHSKEEAALIAQVQNWKRKLSNHLSINLAYSKIVNMTACTTQRTTDSGANFWVGLARGGDGGFSWVDGTPFDLEFWLDGEPNSSVSDNLDAFSTLRATMAKSFFPL